MRVKNTKGCNQYGHADDCNKTDNKLDKRVDLQLKPLSESKNAAEVPPNPYIPAQLDRADKLPVYADDELIDAFMDASVMAEDGENRYTIWRSTGVDVGMTPQDIEMLRLINDGVSAAEFQRRTGQNMAYFIHGLKEIGRVKQNDRYSLHPRGAVSRFGRRLSEREREARGFEEVENRCSIVRDGGSFNRCLEWKRILLARQFRQRDPRASWLQCYIGARLHFDK